MELNFPTVTNEPAKYQPTSHGGRTLIDSNNYMYIKSKSVKERIYWMCQRAKSKMLPYCPAKAVTVGDTIKHTSAHNHGSDPVNVELKAAEKKILQVRAYFRCIMFLLDKSVVARIAFINVCMYLLNDVDSSPDSAICRLRHDSRMDF
jgi:hypothetical protein